MTYTYRQGPPSGGAGPMSFFGPLPPTVMYLIIANVAVFLVTVFLPNLMIALASLIAVKVYPGLQLWRLGTYLFLHADFAHLLFNMLALWWFGAPLEQIWGRRRFLTYFFLCGVGAGIVCVPFYYLVGDPQTHILGASGALFGILMAFALVYPNARVYLYFLVPVKVKWLVVAFIVIEFAATASTLGGGRSAVASVAHLSGLAIGYFYLRRFSDLQAYYRRLKTRKKTRPYRVVPGPDDRPPWLH